MKRTIILLGYAAAVLAGCVTTSADLRDRPPHRTATVAGDYHQLAACVMDGLEADEVAAHASYRFLDLADRQKASVVGTLQIGSGDAAIFEASFIQRAEQVVIETRTAMLRAGTGIDARAWPIIDRCAHSAGQP